MVSQPKVQGQIKRVFKSQPLHQLAGWPWVLSSGNFQGLLVWAGAFLLAMVPSSLSTIRINWN